MFLVKKSLQEQMQLQGLFSMEKVARIELPPKLLPVFAPPRGNVRYRCAHGGRGSAKSFSFAMMAAIWGYRETLRILCVREFMSSIKDSFFAELKNVINSMPWLSSQYDIGVDYIKGKNGTLFIFKGIRNNSSSIKSLSSIDLCIAEESEQIGESSWLDLEPTIRAPKSEIWCIWNAKLENSPVDKRFIKNPPDNALVAKLNYSDNPWFPSVLETQRLRDMEIMDASTYRHVWDGAYLKNDEATVFADKWEIKEFTPDRKWERPYHGLDFGFSNDPTAGCKVWIHEENLYIEYEAFKIGLELDDTAYFLKEKIPDIEKHVIRADNARPESISYLKRKGLSRIEACKKGKGSIEDGISFIKSHRRIFVHPRCKNIIEELSLYSYKVDRVTGDISTNIVDTFNHGIDAIRYALEQAMKASRIDYSKLI